MPGSSVAVDGGNTSHRQPRPQGHLSEDLGLFEMLSRHIDNGDLDEVVATTNGSQLARHAEGLYAAGVRGINISMDSLDASSPFPTAPAAANIRTSAARPSKAWLRHAIVSPCELERVVIADGEAIVRDTLIDLADNRNADLVPTTGGCDHITAPICQGTNSAPP